MLNHVANGNSQENVLADPPYQDGSVDDILRDHA